MTGQRKRNWRDVSRELFGEERDRAIREHLDWWRAGAVRDCVEVPRNYPLAKWAQRHSADLAAQRSESEGYYRNTKPRPRGRR